MTIVDDERALRVLAELYARGVDRRDAAVFTSAFLPHGRLRVFNPSEAESPTGEMHGHEQLAAVAERIAAYDRTYHFLGNTFYEVGDGEATGEVYCMAHHLTPNRHGGTNFVMYIRYEDVYRKDADGDWKIADRRVMVDWTEVRAANPPPSRR
jgi:hypothetical protein